MKQKIYNGIAYAIIIAVLVTVIAFFVNQFYNGDWSCLFIECRKIIE